MSPIAERIKLKRKQLKESQAEFGKRFDLSHAAVSDMERGTTTHIPITVLDFVLDINDLPSLYQLDISSRKEYILKVTVMDTPRLDLAEQGNNDMKEVKQYKNKD